MRHRKGNRKLSRPSDQRIALLRSIVRALLLKGKILVTLTRGKEAKRMAEKVIELAKAGDLASRRKAISILSDSKVVGKIFGEAKARYAERKGGYTRLIKVGFRRGDAAPMVYLELV